MLATQWEDGLPSGGYATRHGAEIRVYLADKEKKPLDPTGIEGILEIWRAGSPRKRLETELAIPKGGIALGSAAAGT